MAQQNQDSSPVDPASFPLKRKRGRPRKYDGPGYEPRRRYAQHNTIPTQAYPTSGLSQGPLVNPARNLSGMLSLGPQPISSKHTTISSSHGFQDIQSQSNPAGISTLRPCANPVPPIPTHIMTSGSQKIQAQANTKFFSSDASLSYGSQAIPSQSSPVTSSGIHPQANVPASSSHGPHGLVGQTVSGILDGAFDAGYLLTVRVGSSGDVLKGVVFDPRLCVPVSTENDIAPLLPAITSKGNPCSTAEAAKCKPISSPIQSAPKSDTVASPLQNEEPAALPNPIDHAPESSRPSETASESTTNALGTYNGNPVSDDVRYAVQAEVQTKTLQHLLEPKVTNENQKSLRETPQQTIVGNAESETSLSLAIAKETNQVQSDQTGNVIETTGSDGGQGLIEEYSKIIVEAPAKDQDLHQAVGSPTIKLPGGDQVESLVIKEPGGDQVESSAIKEPGGDQAELSAIKEHEGDQDQNLVEVQSPGQTPKLFNQTSEEQSQLPEEQKSDTGKGDIEVPAASHLSES